MCNLKITLFSIFLLSSCSWGQKNAELNAPPEKDLVDIFDIHGKEFDKFKNRVAETDKVKKENLGDLFSPDIDENARIESSSTNPASQLELAPTPIALDEKLDKKKRENNKKSRKKKSRKKNNKSTSQVDEKVSMTKDESGYPLDFPDNYKMYDSKFSPYWQKFHPLVIVGEKMLIDIKYFGVTAGRIALQTLPGKNIGDHQAFHFHAKLQSAPFYRYIYSLEDYIETYVDKDTFLPLKYALIQRETNQDVDDLQLFDHEKAKTFYWYKRLKKNDEGGVSQENKEDFIPKYIQDSFSALFFIRGMPFNTGDIYEFPIVTRAKIWIIKTEVLGLDTVTIAGQDVEAYKLKAETHYPGVLKKQGDVLFWFSADQTRKILKFAAKVKIGTIDGELVSYSYGP